MYGTVTMSVHSAIGLIKEQLAAQISEPTLKSSMPSAIWQSLSAANCMATLKAHGAAGAGQNLIKRWPKIPDED